MYEKHPQAFTGIIHFIIQFLDMSEFKKTNSYEFIMSYFDPLAQISPLVTIVALKAFVVHLDMELRKAGTLWYVSLILIQVTAFSYLICSLTFHILDWSWYSQLD
jgi:hypothetical protein